MKCPKCNGLLRASSSRYSKTNNQYTRTRICDNCKYKTYTIEIERKQYQAIYNMASGLQKLISEYNKSRG